MMHPNAAPHWHGGNAQNHDRRLAKRVTHAERIVLATPWGDIDGTLMDISATGGQIRVANGLMPFIGDEVTLRLVGAGQHAGQIAWVGDEAMGIVFDEAIGNVEELMWLEQRGPEWYGYAGAKCRRTSVWG